MKARLRKDLREVGTLIPTIIPDGGWLGEGDIDTAEYIGYIESSNEEYKGLELLLVDTQLIAVYSIDLEVTKE
jgi:hypothetical protein